jgi:hypothetical protein
MKVYGILGKGIDALVEFNFEDDRESNYMLVDEFTNKYGKQALYGFKIDIVECEEGTLYIC